MAKVKRCYEVRFVSERVTVVADEGQGRAWAVRQARKKLSIDEKLTAETDRLYIASDRRYYGEYDRKSAEEAEKRKWWK